jgi:hypothetical protein
MIQIIIALYDLFNLKLFRKPVSLFSTYFLIFWFYFFKKKNSKTQTNENLIVSLTTFPERISKVHLTIESIMRQTVRPKYVYLWLAKSQFKSIEILPSSLLKLKDLGLKIKFCDEDIRSHKKYYYALKMNDDKIIITVDDDYIYNKNLISELLILYNKNTNSVCCNLANNILCNKSGFLPYKKWTKVNFSKPSKRILAIGAGGILYPPGVMHKEVLNKDVFMELCPLADDLWLNAMTLLNNRTVIKTERTIKNLPIFYLVNKNLTTENVAHGKNDTQIKSLKDYLTKNFSNPYLI